MPIFSQTVKHFRPGPNLSYRWAFLILHKILHRPINWATSLENSRPRISLFSDHLIFCWLVKTKNRSHARSSGTVGPQNGHILKSGVLYFSRRVPYFGYGWRSFPSPEREKCKIYFPDMWKTPLSFFPEEVNITRRSTIKWKKLKRVKILKQCVTPICVLQFPHIGGMETAMFYII